MRRARGAWLLRRTGAVSTPHVIDGGEGVRLHGMHSRVPDRPARGLALLLHGWEGSIESSYMRLTAARLLHAGFDVFRLNFRDHGDTHHLNEALFHSNRIDEVVNAAVDVERRFADGRPIERGPVNIHQVLNHVRRLSQNGFGKNVRFVAKSAVKHPVRAAMSNLLGFGEIGRAHV